MRRGAALACALGALLAPALARANGAFPDGAQVLLPADRPGTIVVGTNFGLVITEDGGAGWRWVCEHGGASAGTLYQVTAPPLDRVLALAIDGLVATDDLGCRWTPLRAPDLTVFDYFVDPNTPERVLLIAARGADRVIVESSDGGATAGRLLYTAPAFRELTTVESARSDPRVVYATLRPNDPTQHDLVARSGDGGATWAVLDAGAQPDGGSLWIAGVDRTDAQRLYLRVIGSSGGESFAVSADGGRSVTPALSTAGRFSAFVQLAGGTLLVAALAGGDAHMYRSRDGGRSFVELSAPLHPRALGARDGVVYAVTDDLLDHQALALSRDEGDTWERVMSYADVRETAACNDLRATCSGICLTAAQQRVLRTEVCGAPATPATTGGASSGGCACATARPRAPALALLAALAVLLRGKLRRNGT